MKLDFCEAGGFLASCKSELPDDLSDHQVELRRPVMGSGQDHADRPPSMAPRGRGRVTFAGSALLAASLATGCYAHWDVPHEELPKLHGWTSGQRVSLADRKGKVITFDARTELEGADGDGRRMRVSLDSATVTNGTFEGHVAEPTPGVVRFPLTPGQSVPMRRFSGGRTAVAIAAPAGGAAVLILLALALSSVRY